MLSIKKRPLFSYWAEREREKKNSSEFSGKKELTMIVKAIAS
jgi:hypothetical protein